MYEQTCGPGHDSFEPRQFVICCRLHTLNDRNIKKDSTKFADKSQRITMFYQLSLEDYDRAAYYAKKSGNKLKMTEACSALATCTYCWKTMRDALPKK